MAARRLVPLRCGRGGRGRLSAHAEVTGESDGSDPDRRMCAAAREPLTLTMPAGDEPGTSGDGTVSRRCRDHGREARGRPPAATGRREL